MLNLSSLLQRRGFIISQNVTKYIKSGVKELVDNIRKDKDYLMRRNKSDKYWEVLGCGSYGIPASVLLRLGSSRYLFNCGEGVQRQVLRTQLSQVFITSRVGRCLAGLPSLENTVNKTNIHGPSGCKEFLQATKGFLSISKPETLSDTTDVIYEDERLKVKCIKMIRNKEKRRPDFPSVWTNESEIERKEYDSTVFAFICKVKHSVDSPVDDSTALVLDIPDEEYLDNLETLERFKALANVETIFHFSPCEVVETQKYRKWLRMQGGNISHVFLNENCRNLGLSEVSSLTHKLQVIRRELFPDFAGVQDNSAKLKIGKLGDFSEVEGVTGLRVNIEQEYSPKIDFSKVVLFDKESSVRELLEGSLIPNPEKRNEYVELLQKDLANARSHQVTMNDRREYPVITFLGTGGTKSNRYRNVSGILVETEPGLFLMLDCGEGTMSQLVRMKGKEEAEKILMGLRGVYISHTHADHHMGLSSIIKHRERAFICRGRQVDKLMIICTERLSQYLVDYHTMYEPILSHAHLLSCEHLLCEEGYNEEHDHNVQEVLSYLGLVELVTCKAVHCEHSFCLSLRTTARYKLAYSGDTRPCQSFLNICIDGGVPDLLIHEATVEHVMRYDAIIKRHTTFTEAIEVGQSIGAKFTILTHFSGRYSRMPSMEEIEGKPNVGIAFDNMVVRPNNMHLIPSIYGPLARFFSNNQASQAKKTKKYNTRNVDRGSLTKHLKFDNSLSNFEKKKLANEFVEKHEDKHQWLLKINKRKVLMKKMEDKFN